MDRRPPAPAYPLQPGFAYVAIPEPTDRWRLESDRTCRMVEGTPRRRCTNPAVAALNRGYRRTFCEPVDSWWPYCEDHLYGRWIEDGVLMIWVAREAPHVQ